MVVKSTTVGVRDVIMKILTDYEFIGFYYMTVDRFGNVFKWTRNTSDEPIEKVLLFDNESGLWIGPNLMISRFVDDILPPNKTFEDASKFIFTIDKENRSVEIIKTPLT